MPLNIIRADITKVKADAIVNTANPMVAIGAGVDQAIYDAAGAEQLLAERAKIGPMKPGQAAATPAFGLDAKYIIHTIGPAWEGGKYGEYDAVASCYKESLKIADELHCESIAFPLISTGTLGFPKDKALKIAINEISSFLFEHDMKVYMVVYDKEAFVISGKAFAGVRTYIEERDVKPPAYSSYRRERRNRDLMYHRTEQSIGGHFPGAAKEDISLAEEALETNKESTSSLRTMKSSKCRWRQSQSIQYHNPLISAICRESWRTSSRAGAKPSSRCFSDSLTADISRILTCITRPISVANYSRRFGVMSTTSLRKKQRLPSQSRWN